MELSTQTINVYICENGHLHKAEGCPNPKEKSLEEKFTSALAETGIDGRRDAYYKTEGANQPLVCRLSEIARKHFESSKP